MRCWIRMAGSTLVTSASSHPSAPSKSSTARRPSSSCHKVGLRPSQWKDSNISSGEHSCCQDEMDRSMIMLAPLIMQPPLLWPLAACLPDFELNAYKLFVSSHQDDACAPDASLSIANTQ